MSDKLLTPRDWQAQAQREASELLGTPEGEAKLVEAKRYGMLADALDQNHVAQNRNMVRQRAEDVVRAFELLGAARGIAEDHQARLECEGTMVALKNALNAQPKREPVRLTDEQLSVLFIKSGLPLKLDREEFEEIADIIEAAVLKANGIGGE
jgi:hypothetical protein